MCTVAHQLVAHATASTETSKNPANRRKPDGIGLELAGNERAPGGARHTRVKIALCPLVEGADSSGG